MGPLKCDEVKTDTGVKRTLTLSGNSIAIVYVDSVDVADPHFTLWWRLNDEMSLEDIIKRWLTQVLPANGVVTSSVAIMLELWMSGNFHEIELQPPVSGDSVLAQIHETQKAQGVLEHILLNSQQRVVEFTVKENKPMRCFCTFQKVKLPPFGSFFQAYHESAEVRSRTGILEEANKNLHLFSPVPVDL